MRNPADPKDADLVRMGDFVRAEQGHLGFLVDDDGQRCGFVDEHGDAVAPGVMARLLVEGELSEHPRAAVVEAEPATVLRAAVERRAGRLVMAEATSQSVWTAMEREGAVLGGCDGRLWFRDEGPVCDAVITLARTLDLLSRSDRPLSEIAALDLEDAVAEPADSNAAQHGIAATKVAGTLPLRVPSAEQAIDPRSCTNHSADGTRRGSVPATLPGSTANSLRTQ
jgi:phosphomannomutase